MPNLLINVTTRGVKGATSGMKKLSGSLMSLSKVAMVGAAGGALALGVAMKKASANAGIQEAAEKKLQTALGHTNKKLLEQASAFQQQSKFGDEALIEMMALASNMGIAEDQIADTTQMAIGLSEALGVDMNMAMKAAAGAIQGDTNMLTRYIPELKTTTDQAAKLAIVQTAANKGFEQSKALTDTMTGSMNQASMAIGDASESLGMLIAPLIKAGASMTEDFAVKAGEAFKLLDKINFTKTFQNMFKNLSGFGKAILESYKAIWSFIPEIFRGAFNKILPIAKQVSGALIQGMKNVGEFIFEPIVMAGEIMGVKIINFFIDAINSIKELYNSMADFFGLSELEITPRLSEKGLSMANTRMGVFMSEMANNNIDTSEDLTNAMTDIWTKYAEQTIAIDKATKEATGGAPVAGITTEQLEDQKGKVQTLTETMSAYWGDMTDKQKSSLQKQGKAFGSNIQTMAKAFPEMEKAGKRAAQVQALVDTYASANAAFKAMAGIPVVGPVLAVAAATAAIGAGLANVKMIESAATGANFVTSGPQLMMVGDNPSKREHVQVTPLGGDLIENGPQGSPITVNVSGNLMSTDYIEGELADLISEAARRGTDFGQQS